MNYLEVKKIRKELGLTQEEFAKELGFNPRTIQKWEGNETKIRPSTKILIENLHALRTKGVNSDVVENKNGNQFTELPDGTFLAKVPLVPFNAYASFIEVFGDEYKVIEEFETTYFTVDKVGRGKYIAFKTKNDSMNGGSLNDTPSGSQVLGRELGRQHWQDGFHKTDYGWIIVCINGIFHKDISNSETKGIIICQSRNNSPEFPDFELKLDEVHSIFKVIKRTF